MKKTIIHHLKLSRSSLSISVKKEAVVMVSVIVVAAYVAILVAKWNYFAKYNKSHK